MASSMTCTTGLHALHLRAAAVVLAPLTEERFLPLPQQFQAGQIDGLWVVRRIVDVIGPRPHLRKLAGGAGLELSVFQNGEIDAADDHPCEVDADVAVDGRGIGRIRQMPTLLPLHLIHIRDGIAIASVGIAFDVGLDHHRARERLVQLEIVQAAEQGRRGELLELRTCLARNIDPLHSDGADLHEAIMSIVRRAACSTQASTGQKGIGPSNRCRFNSHTNHFELSSPSITFPIASPMR